MDQERRTQKALAKIEEENKARTERPPEGGVTETRSCLTCGTVGHLCKDCPKTKPAGAVGGGTAGASKASSQKVVRTGAKLNALATAPVIPCPACKKQHPRESGNGTTLYLSRLYVCPIWDIISGVERARVLTGAKGCAVCTDWTGRIKRIPVLTS